MKKLLFFLTIILISCSAWGADIPAGTTFFLKPNNDWKSSNQRFAIYFFGGSSNETWVNMEQISDEWWAAKSPTGNYTKLIYVRLNGSNQSNNWNNKWNQTADLTYDGKNVCEITGWDQSQNYNKKINDYYIAGSFTNWEHKQMINGSISYILNSGEYEFKINDGSWEFDAGHQSVKEGDFKSNNTYGNIKISLKEKTNITISFDGVHTTINYTNLTINNTTIPKDAKYGKLTYQFSMPSDQWYWISLPFNVNIDQITTSTGNGAKDLVITYYDAKIRAEKGKGGWMDVKEQNLTTLTANQGYVIGFYTNNNKQFPAEGVTVTFPSNATTNTVSDQAKATTIKTNGNGINDNWNIIGTGLYRQGSLSNINYVAMPAKNDKGEDTYEYKYISSGNELFTGIVANSFAPFTAFFVQYGGDYSATADNAQSAALAPVARAKAQEQEQIYLINMNEAHTVVILNAEGSEGYTAGEDFLEMNASNHSDLIYSFDGSDALAFNHRATEAQSIALGGYVATAGEQIISLKGYNANVESVTLVDNVTGETADLLAGDYTFNAEVGSLDGRFTVVFGAPKAGDTTVDCYNSTANQLIAYGSANACTVSGLTTGEAVVVYNAMGQLVFATIADSETITLPSLTTGNYLILHNGTTNKVLLK